MPTHRFEYLDTGELKRVALEHAIASPGPSRADPPATKSAPRAVRPHEVEMERSTAFVNGVPRTSHLCTPSPPPPTPEPVPRSGIDVGVILAFRTCDFWSGYYTWNPDTYAMAEQPNVVGVHLYEPEPIELEVIIGSQRILLVEVQPGFASVFRLNYDAVLGRYHTWRDMYSMNTFQARLTEHSGATRRVGMALGIR